MLPNSKPHELVNMQPIHDGSIWKDEHKPLMVRWTTDYDCSKSTNWWYCIKDTPYEIDELKAKRRYIVKQGMNNFDVKVIDPVENAKAILHVYKQAISSYPAYSRPMVNDDMFLADIYKWSNRTVFGAFYKETKMLCGYAYLYESADCAELAVVKSIPDYEKLQVNAAIMYEILHYYEYHLEKDYYIVDGERNILHSTAFQDYLEKYFGFRKAYCKLHLIFRKDVKMVLMFLQPFSPLLRKCTKVGIVRKICALLTMNNIARNSDTKSA